MNYPRSEAQPNPESNAPHVGFLRRAARNMLHRLTPPVPYDRTQFDETTGVYGASTETFPTILSPEPTISITMDEAGSFLVDDGETSTSEPLTTRYDSVKLLREFATIYIAMGAGEHLISEITAQVRYQPSTIISVASRLADLFPAEIITLSTGENQEDQKIRLGNLALATSLPNQLEAQQTAEQIDEGKLDLTTQAHAIIRTFGSEEAEFYLPLHTPAALIAARVIESIKHIRENGTKKNVPSSVIAGQVWQSMTLVERQTIVDDTDLTTAADAPESIDIPVIRVLRRLTHRLMLTHERHNDRFTLLDTELSIEYSDQPLDEEQTEQYPNLRPIIAPQQVQTEPNEAKQLESKDMARAYMRQARNRNSVVDEDAIAMLDFLMSPDGHWAVQAVAGEKGLFKTHAGAMYAMHTYLRVNFHGYGPAYRSRLIGGDRRVRRGRGSGKIRQVGGAIPKDSNWTLGQGMQEFFGETTPPAEDR